MAKKTYTITQVDRMKGQGREFEDFIEMLFRRLGTGTVERTERTPVTKDHGCDIIIHFKNGNRLGIQCKQLSSSSGSVGNKAAMEIVHSQKMYGLTHLMVITNRKFSEAFKESARTHRIEMWDRDIVKQKIDDLNNLVSREGKG